MKKIVYTFFLSIVLYSCDYKQPCDSVSQAKKNYLNVKIVSSLGVGGFVDNGYTSFEVTEVNQSFPTDYNAFYEGSGGVNFTSLKLPIAHNYSTTTFVFKGANIPNDTIQVNGYNPHAELTDDCGYRLSIDEPNISIFTFAVKSKPVWDDANKILTFQIQK
jgi:hypothetical protein